MPDTIAQGSTVAADISRGAVQMLREYTGRGPTKAHTIINTNTIAIVLGDTLTRGEHSLVRMGKQDHVLETRHNYQMGMRDDLIQLVEGLSGRKVDAMLSANHIDPDLGVEFFVLEPLPERSNEKQTANPKRQETQSGPTLGLSIPRSARPAAVAR